MEPTIISNFSPSAIVAKSFEIFGKRFLYFLCISVLVNLPAYLLTVFFFNTNDVSTFLSPTWLLANTAISLFVSAILTSSLIKITFETLRGGEASIKESLSVCVKYFFQVALGSVFVIFLVVIGMVLLLIPGLIAAVRLYFTIPAIVVEDLSATDAMSRSNDLSDGYRWSIFAIVIGTGIVNAIVAKIIGSFFLPDQPALYFNCVYAFAALFTPLVAIFQTVAYHDIRSVKEGVDIEQLASVFD